MAKAKAVRLIVGNDDYRVQQEARRTLDGWVPADQAAVALETIDGNHESAEGAANALVACQEALLTPAFFGLIKTVWLREADFLGNTAVSGAAAVKDRLRSLIDWMAAARGDTARWLVTAAKADKRTAFYLACKKHAEIIEFSVPDKGYRLEQYAREQLTGLLAAEGLRANPPVMNAMIERTGADTRQMACELEKLKTYLGDQSVIREADVAEMVSPSRQSIVWEFTDTIGAMNLAAARRVMRRLLFQKEQPARLLGMLDGFIRDMILYRHAIDQHWLRRGEPSGKTVVWTDLPPEVEQFFAETMERDPRTAHPFRIGTLAQTATRMSMPQLLHWRDLVVQTYRRLFSGNLPPDDLIDLLLVRMLAKTRANRPR